MLYSLIYKNHLLFRCYTLSHFVMQIVRIGVARFLAFALSCLRSFAQRLRSCSKIRHVKCSEMYLNTNRNRSQLKPLRRREIKSCFKSFFSNRNWISHPAKTSFGFILITGCKESLRDHHHL